MNTMNDNNAKPKLSIVTLQPILKQSPMEKLGVRPFSSAIKSSAVGGGEKAVG
ncbi:MAG: hypothetical protein ACPGQC_12430 [Limisphaerales bacterium]